jgi:UDP:flavonoid glycosyltransferase YjiC (YdhE family)
LFPGRDDRAVRVLFSCIPSEGHFSPLLPLARALAARGHEVAFAVAESWRFRPAEEGFDSFAAGPDAGDVHARFEPERREIFTLPPEQRRPLQFSGLFGRMHAPEKLGELLLVARGWGAEAIVFDSADLAAPIAAAVLDVPTVNHSFGAMIPFKALERAAAVVEPLWRQHALEPDAHAGAFGGLFVDIAPESFAWERPLGRVVRMRPAPGAAGTAPAWLDELGEPLVYVTLGTVWNRAEVFRLLLDGLEGDFSALLTTGRDVDPASLGPPPPRVRVERFVPQAHVLPRCAAVVSHGGSGTTLAALAHGLPLVLVPQAADQFDNAARAEAAGAATVLRPEELTAEALRAGVERVLGEPAFEAAARRIAAEIERMGTPDEVAAAVEEHVARG